MQIIAHRGASARQVENSAAAFKAALQEGADGIETDLRISRDGEIFLFHDNDLHRLTGSRGALENRTAAQMRQARLQDGQPFMTLHQLLKLLHGNQLLINLELKGGRESQLKLAEALAAILGRGPKASGPANNFIISSFMPAGLERLRTLRPELPRALLWSGRGFFLLALLRARKLAATALHIPLRACSRSRVAASHAAGMSCRVYTVNQPAVAEKCRKLGVDAIFTDDPAAMRAAMSTKID